MFHRFGYCKQKVDCHIAWLGGRLAIWYGVDPTISFILVLTLFSLQDEGITGNQSQALTEVEDSVRDSPNPERVIDRFSRKWKC